MGPGPTANRSAAGSFLIVRLGALGDIVHGLPFLAALRSAFPDARIDWLASARHREILDLVPSIDTKFLLSAPDGIGTAPGRLAFPGPAGTLRAIGALRRLSYDAAFDLQGLIKSAVLARLSGARRVIGFAGSCLREPPARFFYTETSEPPGGVHVIDKNLAQLEKLGIRPEARREFPLERRPSSALDEVRRVLAAEQRSAFAVLNPGAGWPNKRWPPERFGEVASALLRRYDLRSFVTWGKGEEMLAREVVSRSEGASLLAPQTTVSDLVALLSEASLVVSGDTGPLHVAAATRAPLVGIYGPTNPSRNGPWDAKDVSLSRFDVCDCHHKRRCSRRVPCIEDITVEEVLAAIDSRLAAGRAHA